MSGHSHWAGIKHKEAVTDAQRARTFTKAGYLIALAAQEGGGNPAINFKLKLAIDRAHAVNLPKENIDRAIKKGSGELSDGAYIEELLYAASFALNKESPCVILIEVATDNRNRTVSEIKAILAKNGAKFIVSTSIQFLFRRVGRIVLAKQNSGPQEELLAIDAGAEDLLKKNGFLVVFTEVTALQKVSDTLRHRGLSILSAELIYRPLQLLPLTTKQRKFYDTLAVALEEQDDVQNIFSNASTE